MPEVGGRNFAQECTGFGVLYPSIAARYRHVQIPPNVSKHSTDDFTLWIEQEGNASGYNRCLQCFSLAGMTPMK
jgi:hypothetical protein